MAIATYYRGIEYRSRLEAKWASFFTRIGWRFTYEPLDGDGYIPDFWIHGRAPMLVEVKPASSLHEYRAPIDKITTGLRRHWHHDILIVGVDPLPDLDSGFGQRQFPSAGLLGEWVEEGTWDFATANWATCGECGRHSVFHDAQTWNCRPCNHYHGDDLLMGAWTAETADAWAEATNDVKWRGRDAA